MDISSHLPSQCDKTCRLIKVGSDSTMPKFAIAPCFCIYIEGHTYQKAFTDSTVQQPYLRPCCKVLAGNWISAFHLHNTKSPKTDPEHLFCDYSHVKKRSPVLFMYHFVCFCIFTSRSVCVCLNFKCGAHWCRKIVCFNVFKYL